MIKREILTALEAWKNKSDHRPRVLRGARQVGKTTVVNEFGKSFDTYLHLNLEKKTDADLFERIEEVNELIDEIHLHLKVRKHEGSVLLFIDEIQNSPKAIASLRYFYEERPEIYVIAAGSLLESLIDVHVSFPVGRVEYLAMRPCSFLEYLNGVGEEFDADVIRNRNVNSLHERIIKHFRKYMIIGGMPAIIDKFAENNDILATDSLYEALIASYREDSEKYAKNETQRKVLSYILTSGWAEAAETISFEGFAGSNFKSREVSEAMTTLQRAMLLELAYPVVSPKIPLLPNMKRRPKLLWFDTGLVNYQAGIRDSLFSKSDVMDMWRGRLGEQIVAQELIAYNHSILAHRWFWSKDKKDGNAEVDFVIQYGTHIIPIEVKTGHNSKLKSLHSFMDLVSHDVAIRIWNEALSIDKVKTLSGKDYTLINLPFYYISQLSAILHDVFNDLV